MTGPQILIVAIIIVLVIAFIVTMLFVNAQVPTSQATTGAITGHRRGIAYLRVRSRRHTTFGSLPQVASTTPPEPKATDTLPILVGEACPSASSLMQINNKHKNK